MFAWVYYQKTSVNIPPITVDMPYTNEYVRSNVFDGIVINKPNKLTPEQEILRKRETYIMVLRSVM